MINQVTSGRFFILLSVTFSGLALCALWLTNTTLTTASTEEIIDICSQHAPKCPLTAATWPEANDDWLYTAKQWQHLPFSAEGLDVVWEWSAPYMGSNPLFDTYRENHYTDYSQTPNDSPNFVRDERTFDWERWSFISNNLLLHAYGGATEEVVGTIGETNCTDGLFYPVIDHQTQYVSTTMASTHIDGDCVEGGYMVTHLRDLWDAPLSAKRLSMCDDVTHGIPADINPKGNAICKTSPYAGVVTQRYVLESNASAPVNGCETVTYIWGWSEPTTAASGQDYETWFRNGELRWSRWGNVGSKDGQVPAPDDHAWWNERCDSVSETRPDVAYAGIFKIGNQLYTDSISLENSFVLSQTGGTFTLTASSNIYHFPADILTGTLELTEYSTVTQNLPALTELIKPQTTLTVSQNSSFTLSSSYTVTMVYPESSVSNPAALQIYQQDTLTGTWVLVPDAITDATANTVTFSATTIPSSWIVVEAFNNQLFLPSIIK